MKTTVQSIIYDSLTNDSNDETRFSSDSEVNALELLEI